MRKEKFVNGEIYHILNRGVDKRILFLENGDYMRFIHNIYEFNDEKPAPNVYRHNIYDFGNHKERSLIVEVLAFCLMPNHYHLLIRQLKDDGISIFMKKLGCGYANYFNKKNQRSGALFQGRFKAVLVESDRHLFYLPYYIHLNPLDIIMKEWRQGKISDSERAIKFLRQYRWSSLIDYLGHYNFPYVTERNFLMELIGRPKECNLSLEKQLRNFDFNAVDDFKLE